MRQGLFASLALLAFASVAQAGPTTEVRRDKVVTPHHDYWLSDGLNKLVFWKAPGTDRVETRRQ